MKRLVAVATLAGCLAGGGAGAQQGCDPAVARALADSAEQGVAAESAIVRHPDQGIRDPDSILDFGCIEDMFNFGGFDMMFNHGSSMTDLLGLVQRTICNAARNAYRRYVDRPLDAGFYTAAVPRLPGLPDIAERPYQPTYIPPPRHPPPPTPPPDARPQNPDADLFRSLIQGGNRR